MLCVYWGLAFRLNIENINHLTTSALIVVVFSLQRTICLLNCNVGGIFRVHWGVTIGQSKHF